MDTSNVRAALEHRLQSATGPWDRLPILMELTKEPTRNDPDYSHRCATEALHLAKELGDPFWIAAGMHAVGLNLIRTARYSEVLFYLKQASHLFATINHPLLRAQVDLSVADIRIIIGELPEALKLLAECLSLFEESKDRYWTVRTLRSLGDIHKAAGDHGKSLKHYHRAIALAGKSNIRSELGTLYRNIAETYRRLGDGDHYGDYLFKSLALHKRENNMAGMAAAMEDIATMYIDKEHFARAEKYVRQSGRLYGRLGYAASEAGAWGKLGYIYSRREEFAVALRCYRIGLALAAATEDNIVISDLYAQYGATYRMAGQAGKSLPYIRKALSIIRGSGHPFYEYELHRNLALSYEATGAPAAALAHYKEYHRIKEGYINSRKCLEVNRVETRAQLHRLARHLRNERSKNLSLKKQVEEKETALVSLTLELLHKEEKEKTGGARTPTTPSSPTTGILSGSWEIFARQFHKIHHGFQGKLIQRCPELSLTEMKVCSLIRIGLSSKEIASILCVSKRTVDCHREHIHKKLRLSTRALLTEFIGSL